LFGFGFFWPGDKAMAARSTRFQARSPYAPKAADGLHPSPLRTALHNAFLLFAGHASIKAKIGFLMQLSQ
jgi:hypothetical protein